MATKKKSTKKKRISKPRPTVPSIPIHAAVKDDGTWAAWEASGAPDLSLKKTLTEDDCIYEGPHQAGCRNDEPKCLPCALRRVALLNDRLAGLAISMLPSEEEVKKVEGVVSLETEITELKERLREQHVVVRELALFTEGIILSEYVNAHDTTGYHIGVGRVGSFVEKSRLLAMEK
jgi:hypothetical protein